MESPPTRTSEQSPIAALRSTQSCVRHNAPSRDPTTSVPPHSTTDDQRLSDISASDPDSVNLLSGARNEWEDVNGGKSEKMSTWNRMKQGVGHVRRRSRSNSVQRSLREVSLSYKDRPTTPMHTHQPSTGLLQYRCTRSMRLRVLCPSGKCLHHSVTSHLFRLGARLIWDGSQTPGLIPSQGCSNCTSRGNFSGR